MHVSSEHFELLVSQALDEIPEELLAMLQNVVVLVADDPPADEPDLLGLYEGTPLTERGEFYFGSLPDRIFIYRNPIMEMCADEQEIVAEVSITVVHEVAHHFGIPDERLHELGWG